VSVTRTRTLFFYCSILYLKGQPLECVSSLLDAQPTGTSQCDFTGWNGLNVCVPPNSDVETLTPQCHGVRRQGLGR
jgi:hypothetical protein